jgi:hypothetical protein
MDEPWISMLSLIESKDSAKADQYYEYRHISLYFLLPTKGQA